jgi:hypothetical protein
VDFLCRGLRALDASSGQARARALVQSSAASLEIISSTSRDTKGKPDVMPKSLQLMLLREKAGPPRPAPGFAPHGDVDGERLGDSEHLQIAETRTV